MAEPFDQGEFKRAAFLPEITLDVYDQLPEDVCEQIEVVDGWMVRCGSPTFSHQTIAHNFVSSLRDAVKSADRKEGSCHKVAGDYDVLISETSKFHFRRPDVVAFRCVDYDRGKWGRKPYASDCVLVIEVVSADSVTTDTRDKRAEYAAAGIPNYWIVRMTNNDGPAISVEQFRLTLDGAYISECLNVRRRDFYAVDVFAPFRLRMTWEQLDDGL
jgi:Uma2 family endonuclease